MMEHLNCIYDKKEATGIHFSSTSHSHNDFSVQEIEKMSPNTANYRLEREHFWIRLLGTNKVNAITFVHHTQQTTHNHQQFVKNVFN
jgi:hypothetical protein